MLLAVLAWLVTLPAVQRFAADRLVAQFAARTGGEITYTDLRLNLSAVGRGLVSVEVEGLSVLDSEGREVLSSERAAAALRWRSLPERRVELPYVKVERASGYLYRSATTGRTNLSALIEPFRPDRDERRPAPPAEGRWSASIESFEVQDSELRLDRSLAEPVNRDRTVSELTLELTGFEARRGDVGALLERAAFVLQTGGDPQPGEGSRSAAKSPPIRFKQVGARWSASPSHLRVDDLRVETAASRLAADFAVDVPAWRVVRDDPNALELSIALHELDAWLGEAAAAVPEARVIEQLATPGVPELQYPRIRARGRAGGTAQELSLQEMELSFGEHTRMKGHGVLAGLADDGSVDGPSVDFTVAELVVDRRDLAYGIALDPGLQPWIPEQMRFAGRVRGDRSRLVVRGETVADPFGALEVAAEAESIDGPQRVAYRLEAAGRKLDLGALLPATVPVGRADVAVRLDGRGLSASEFEGIASADVTHLQAGPNLLENISATARYRAGDLVVGGSISDPRLAARGEAALDLNAPVPRYQGAVAVDHADLDELGLAPDPLRIGGRLSLEAAGRTLDTLNGDIAVDDFRVRYGRRSAAVSSARLRVRNRPGYAHMRLASDVADGVFTSSIPVSDLPAVMRQHARQFFRFPGAPEPVQPEGRFVLHLDIDNLHPVLAGFMPELQVLSPGSLRVAFDGATDELNARLGFDRISYGAFDFRGSEVRAQSDGAALRFDLRSREVTAGAVTVYDPTVYGHARDNKLELLASALDAERRQLLHLGAEIEARETTLVARLKPDQLIIDDTRWEVTPEHAIRIDPERIAVDELRLGTADQSITLRTVDDHEGRAPLEVTFANLEIATLGRPLGLAEDQLTGVLDGTVRIARRQTEPLVSGELVASRLRSGDIGLGEIGLRGGNYLPGRFGVAFHMDHYENRVSGSGSVLLAERSADFAVEVEHLDLAYLQAAALGEPAEARGHMTGLLSLGYDPERPVPLFGDGELRFHQAMIAPAALGTEFYIDDQAIAVSETGLRAERFLVSDAVGNRAQVDGGVELSALDTVPRLDLRLRADRFMLMDTSAADDDLFFGRVVLDSDLRLSGTPDELLVEGAVGLQSGSRVSFVMPDRAPPMHEGEGVVRFVEAEKHYDVPRGREYLEMPSRDGLLDTTLERLDLSVEININPDTQVSILVDRQSGDRLTLRGGGNLSLAVAPTGEITLTGSYAITQGEYDLRFHNIVRRRFAIEPGSTVSWTGDPYDAELNINAIYRTRTSPENLFAAYVPDQERQVYRTELPFMVVLRMRGRLSEPEISFALDMPAEARTAVAGAVYSRVQQVNEDEAERNRQAFSLIVLNQFIAEDFTGVDQSAALVPGGRSSVARLLTAQLNALSGRILPGTDLRFEVESYEEFTEEGPEGRTEVHVDLTQELFGNRLILQLGGQFDVEGERRREAGVGDFAGDLSAEYLVTQDGRYRLRAFRRTAYEGPIEGPLTSAGVSVLYTRQFDRFGELFRRPDPDEEIPVMPPEAQPGHSPEPSGPDLLAPPDPLTP